MYVTKLLLCGNLSTFLRCVSPSSSRANTVRNVATYFAYSLVRTHFTTHEAFYNENRLNFRKYYLVFSRPSARRVGHKEAAGIKKEEGTIRIYRFQSYTSRLFSRSSIYTLLLSCAACHSSAFSVEKSRFISYDWLLLRSSVVFSHKCIVSVGRDVFFLF